MPKLQLNDRSLVGKRLLVDTIASPGAPHELILLEVAPSGQYIKVSCSGYDAKWIMPYTYRALEVLGDWKPEPPSPCS
jgi:hypothetical protein